MAHIYLDYNASTPIAPEVAAAEVPKEPETPGHAAETDQRCSPLRRAASAIDGGIGRQSHA